MNKTTLCYVHIGEKILMLRRNKKKNDENAGKYVGLGGHFEDGETAEIVQESKIDSIIEKGSQIRLGVKTEKINVFDETGSYNLVEGVVNDYDVYKKEA